MRPLLARPVFEDQVTDNRTVIAKTIYLNKSIGWESYLEGVLISLCKCLIPSVGTLLVHNLLVQGAKPAEKRPACSDHHHQARIWRLISWTAETMAVTASGGVN